MVKRKITGIIALDGRTFRAGDEERLAEAAARRGTDLMGPAFAPALAGDWSNVEELTSDTLPEGFPGLKHLEAEGILTYSDMEGRDLVDVPGITRTVASRITKAMAARGV